MNQKQTIALLRYVKKQIPKTCQSFAANKTISGGSDRLYLRITQPDNPHVTDIEIKEQELLEISTITINDNKIQNQQYWYYQLKDPNTITSIKTKLQELYPPTNITT